LPLEPQPTEPQTLADSHSAAPQCHRLQQ
jgi:hypothetical protein